MTIYYAIAGGQLIFDKTAFAREILLPDSILKKLLKTEEMNIVHPPKITKSDHQVIIDYNGASDIPLDEKYIDLFSNLKNKYKDKIRGRVVVRISALTSYLMTADFNGNEIKVGYN